MLDLLVCPFCHARVRNLGVHAARSHPGRELPADTPRVTPELREQAAQARAVAERNRGIRAGALLVEVLTTDRALVWRVDRVSVEDDPAARVRLTRVDPDGCWRPDAPGEQLELSAAEVQARMIPTTVWPKAR